MNVGEFVEKWSTSELKETASFQAFFDDLCRVVGHPTPSQIDPTGTYFTYEKRVVKTSGERGFADAWYRGRFGWEHKGRHKDLAEAYEQLLQYREDLENPPLLVVSDFERIVIHTNFTNSPKAIHEVHLSEFPDNLEVIEALFFQPDSLRPEHGKPEALTTAPTRPQLSLRLDVSDLPRVYSSYGAVYAEGFGACPPVEGHAALGIVVVNSSRGRTARSIKVQLDIRPICSTRPECRRSCYIPTSGWSHSDAIESVQRFRFDGGLDDVCLHDDELPLGRLDIVLRWPKEAVDFKSLLRESDGLQTRVLLEAVFHNPTGFPGTPVLLRERLLSVYNSAPAEDSYQMQYRVGAEGFEQTSGEMVISITWSRYGGSLSFEETLSEP